MTDNPYSQRPADDRAFTCHWSAESPTAASVQVRGEVDLATSSHLERVLGEALDHARLVVVSLHEVSFMDSAGLHLLLSASQRARERGVWLILLAVPRQIQTLLEVTRTRGLLHILDLGVPAPEAGSTSSARSAWIDPPDIKPLANPANARVVSARIMAIPDAWLWLQSSDGAIRRAWTPRAADPPQPAGPRIEVYLDAGGEVNGWYDHDRNLAINQRRLASGAPPSSGAALACQGACGIVWQSPAPEAMLSHDERCLTCAGPLARR